MFIVNVTIGNKINSAFSAALLVFGFGVLGLPRAAEAAGSSANCRNVNGAKSCGPTSIHIFRVGLKKDVLADGLKTKNRDKLAADSIALDVPVNGNDTSNGFVSGREPSFPRDTISQDTLLIQPTLPILPVSGEGSPRDISRGLGTKAH